MNADGSQQVSLTGSGGRHRTWSPDGSKIAFASLRTYDYEIYVMNGDGSQQTQITSSVGRDHFLAGSPDGSKIAFVSERDFHEREIYVMNADGSERLKVEASSSTASSPRTLGTRQEEGSDPLSS